MKTRFGSAHHLTYLFLLLLPACFPGSSTNNTVVCPEGGCSERDTGSLSYDGLTIAWTPGSSWDQGRCVDLTLTNTGPDLESWSLVVRLDQAVENWLSATGGVLSANEDTLSIQPYGETALENGGSLDLQYCVEPSANPLEVVSVDRVETPGTPAPALGSLQDDSLLLAYRSEGMSYGGYCLEMTLTNLSEKDVASWEILLSMEERTEVTDYWGFTALGEESTIRLYPGTGTATMEPYQSRTGTMCLSPLVEPSSMDAQVHYSDGTGSGDEETTPVPVVTGSVQDDPLLLTYRSTNPSKGGMCLEMTFTNLSAKELSTWSAALSMSGPVYLTDFWSVAPAVEGNILTIYPGTGAHTIDPYEARTGTVCMNPLETPQTMNATVTYAE